MISLILPLEACVYNQLLELEVGFEDWFLLKFFDLASTLLLGLERIGGGILEMLACLSFDNLLVVIFLVDAYWTIRHILSKKFVALVSS